MTLDQNEVLNSLKSAVESQNNVINGMKALTEEIASDVAALVDKLNGFDDAALQSIADEVAKLQASTETAKAIAASLTTVEASTDPILEPAPEPEPAPEEPTP